METNKIAVLAALFMFALLAVSAYSAPAMGMAAGREKIGERMGNAPAKAQGVGDPYYLDTRATHLVCRIDFTTTVIDSVVAAVPETADELSGHSAKLKDDKSQLATLASSGDRDGFNSFVSGTVRPDMAGAIAALAKERRNYRSYNLTNETISSLRAGYNSAHEQMKECEQGSIVELGQARIRQYNAVIDGWQSATDKLGEKGVSTAGMQGVIDGAKSGVIAPLQAAIDSGDSEAVKAALKTYCLGNGCEGSAARGAGELAERNSDGSGDSAPQNYHGFAKMNLERLQAIVDKLQETSDSTLLDEAEAKLATVRETLSGVGGNQYGTEQQEAVWGNLREAAKLVRDYMRESRPGTAAASTARGEAPPAVPAESGQ